MSVTPTMGIVTPEAVVLEFRAAGLATRSLAKVVDLLLEGLGFVMVAVFATWAASGSPTAGLIIISVTVFVAVVLAPALSETFWDGRTPGKALMGIRVVTVDGGPIAFRHAIVRGLLQIVEIPLGVAVFVALSTRRSQRIGDLAAGTFVISERAASAHMVPTAFFAPPGLEAYCSVLDVSSVDSEQFLLVRNFLLRVTELSPEARGELAFDLASAIAPRCTPAPPPGVAPEMYLICVCAAYQLRHGGLAGPVDNLAR